MKHRVIHKFEIKLLGYQLLPARRNMKILSIQWQHGVLCLWAEVDDHEVGCPGQKAIRMFGTGHEFSYLGSDLTYITTIQEGPFVWHFYEDSRPTGGT